MPPDPTPDLVLGSDPEPAGPPGALKPEPALCVSGGGYRAMLFHLGAFWRLNEAGWLRKLKRISSVSGGSIASAVLGLKWPRLGFDATGVAARFADEVVEPLRRLAGTTLDVPSILTGLLWFGTISDRVVKAYRKHLFGSATLQDLPDEPRFVINATNVQTGALWRFSKPYMGDWKVGRTPDPKVELAVAVAASSAFPPVLSPLRLPTEGLRFSDGALPSLAAPPYTTRVVLSDGGVYDNLGLETLWKQFQILLVSDAGGQMAHEPAPAATWGRHAKRVLDVIDNQVRSLRKRQLIDALKSKARGGAYWGIRSDIADFRLPGALPCPHERSLELAATPTRLAVLDVDRQERLINWGYAVCDAAMRKHVDSGIAAPAGFPYPARGI